MILVDFLVDQIQKSPCNFTLVYPDIFDFTKIKLSSEIYLRISNVFLIDQNDF